MAKAAFQAVKDAYKALGDPEGRAAVDAARDDAALRALGATLAAEAERERQWRVAKGLEPAGAPPRSAPRATPRRRPCRAHCTPHRRRCCRRPLSLADPLASLPICHRPLPLSICGRAGRPLYAGREQRDSWMTEMPAERAAPNAANLSQSSVTAFSRAGVKPRGDTSGWTDTPSERARKAALGLTDGSEAGGGGGGPLYLTSSLLHASAAGPAAAAAAAAHAAAEAAALARYTSAVRGKSMVEQHAERQAEAARRAKEERRAARKAERAATEAAEAAAKKKRRKGDGDGGKGAPAAAAAAAAAPAGGDKGGEKEVDWPWRPFDREADLGIKPTGKSAAALMKDGTQLAGRFSSGGHARSFL
jgi:hypothetical protein